MLAQPARRGARDAGSHRSVVRRGGGGASSTSRTRAASAVGLNGLVMSDTSAGSRPRSVDDVAAVARHEEHAQRRIECRAAAWRARARSCRASRRRSAAGRRARRPPASRGGPDPACWRASPCSRRTRACGASARAPQVRPRRAGCARCPRASSLVAPRAVRPGRAADRGSSTRNVVPSAPVRSTSTWPPACSTVPTHAAQAETGALAGRLGREERLEDARQRRRRRCRRRCRSPAAPRSRPPADAPAPPRPGPTATRCASDRSMAPVAANRVARVGHEVDDHLVELRRVDRTGQMSGPEREPEADLVAGQALQGAGERRDRLCRIEHEGCTTSRRAYVSSCAVIVAPRCVASRMAARSARSGSCGRQLLQHQMRVADDDREQVVEVVGDTAGQPPDRLERDRPAVAARPAPPCLLRPLLLGDVLGEPQEVRDRAGLVADRRDRRRAPSRPCHPCGDARTRRATPGRRAAPPGSRSRGRHRRAWCAARRASGRAPCRA